MSAERLVTRVMEGKLRLADLQSAADAVGEPVERLFDDLAAILARRFLDRSCDLDATSRALNGVFGLMIEAQSFPDRAFSLFLVICAGDSQLSGEAADPPADRAEVEARTRALATSILQRG